MRHGRLEGAEILGFYERGYVLVGQIFDDDEIAELQQLVEEVTAIEQPAGRLYDLLDPALWPDADDPEPEYPISDCVSISEVPFSLAST